MWNNSYTISQSLIVNATKCAYNLIVLKIKGGITMSKPRTRWYTTVSIVVMFLFSLTVTSAKAQSNPADLDGQSATTITKQLKNHQYDEQALMQYT